MKIFKEDKKQVNQTKKKFRSIADQLDFDAKIYFEEVYTEVSDLIEKYNLPDGWRTFIIAYILNPKKIGKKLKVIDDLNKRISVERVDNKSIFYALIRVYPKKIWKLLGMFFRFY